MQGDTPSPPPVPRALSARERAWVTSRAHASVWLGLRIEGLHVGSQVHHVLHVLNCDYLIVVPLLFPGICAHRYFGVWGGISCRCFFLEHGESRSVPEHPVRRECRLPARRSLPPLRGQIYASEMSLPFWHSLAKFSGTPRCSQEGPSSRAQTPRLHHSLHRHCVKARDPAIARARV